MLHNKGAGEFDNGEFYGLDVGTNANIALGTNVLGFAKEW